MDKGAVGGGAPARFDSPAPLYAQLLLVWFGWWARLAGIAGGAFQFCTRDAFQAVGGFDEKLFGAEDAMMSWVLKREGRFVVLWPTVVTSGRRMRGIQGLQMLGTLLWAAFFPKTLQHRPSLRIWYASNREESRTISDLLITQGANIFLLLITIVLLTDPIFSLFPQLRTLIGRPLSDVRFVVDILLCHVFLALWPGAGLVSTFMQNRMRP